MKGYAALAVAHGVAGFIHLAALITVCALLPSRSNSYNSWVVDVQWNTLVNAPEPTGISVKPDLNVTPFALMIWIEAITFLFHLGMMIFALTVKPDDNHVIIKTGLNWMRWVTYSLSASAMFVLISFWMGVVQLIEFVMLVGLVISMMILGACAEAVHAMTATQSFRSTTRSKGSYCACGFRGLDWVLYAVGFVPFAFAWAVPYQYFSDIDRTNMPSFVNWIIATQFILFCFFPVWMGIHLSNIIPKNRGLWMEIGYVILSATAKIILVGLVAGPAAAG